MKPLGDEKALDARRVVEAIQAEGHKLILCEGGPHLIGDLLSAALVDELFLTLSPVLAGRGQRHRRGLVEGAELLPFRPRWGTMLSLRRHESHLFLRYDIS